MFCRTAVYQSDGDCMFLQDFADDLNLQTDNSSLSQGNQLLEMRTKNLAQSRFPVHVCGSLTHQSLGLITIFLANVTVVYI